MAMPDMDNSEKNGLKLVAPTYCCFSVTLRCAMRCKSCYIWKQGQDSAQEIPLANWMGAVKSLSGFLDRKTDIIITGGEPLLKENILDLIAFCSKRGIKISLQTSASLIDEELVKRLADAGLWRIGISLYSLEEETHDYLRGRKGISKRVFQAIDLLSKFGPQIGINVQNIIMDINLGEILKMAEWVQNDERIDYIYFLAPMLPFGASIDQH
jgi:MoaA/NifB/PqqE/SkfB family radical SAM enzyme